MATLALQFLLLSTDYEILKPVAAAVRQLGGTLHCAAASEAASEVAARRKLDTIVVDLALAESLRVITEIRGGRSNRHAVIFACTQSGRETVAALAAGANFLFYRPLTDEKVRAGLAASLPMMLQERRRYFRHPISIPAWLMQGEIEERVLTTNLSEGGMAIHAAQRLAPPQQVGFRLQLPQQGPVIEGKGELAWANAGGEMGVRFRFFRKDGEEQLKTWLEHREDVSLLVVPPAFEPGQGTPRPRS